MILKSELKFLMNQCIQLFNDPIASFLNNQHDAAAHGQMVAALLSWNRSRLVVTDSDGTAVYDSNSNANVYANIGVPTSSFANDGTFLIGSPLSAAVIALTSEKGEFYQRKYDRKTRSNTAAYALRQGNLNEPLGCIVLLKNESPPSPDPPMYRSPGSTGVNVLLNIENLTENSISAVNAKIQVLMNGSAVEVFTVPVKPQLVLSDLVGAFPFDFLRIQQIVADVSTIPPAWCEGKTFTFIELFGSTICLLTAHYANAAMRFSMASMTIDLSDPFKAPPLVALISQYSRLNRSLNYGAVFLAQGAVTSANALEMWTVPATFAFQYFFCFTLEAPMGYLFHEKQTKWNGQPLKNLFLNDVVVADVASFMTSQYNGTYSSVDGNALVQYMWTSGLKISFARKLTVNGVACWLGTGVDVSQTLAPSIAAKGDSFFQGNFAVQDDAQNVIFQVDNCDQTIKNMYKIGVGTMFPKTMLDVNDSGIAEIAKMVAAIGESDNYTTSILAELRASTDMSIQGVAAVVENNMGVKGTAKLRQSKDFYYCVFAIDETIVPDINAVAYLYFYNFPEWCGLNAAALLTSAIDQSMVASFVSVAKSMMAAFYDDGMLVPIQSTFIWGVKRNGIFYFRNTNGKLYALATGKNVQNFGMRIYTNPNITAFFNVEDAGQFFMQSILTAQSTTIYNKGVLDHKVQTLISKYPNPSICLYDVSSQTRASLSIDTAKGFIAGTYHPVLLSGGDLPSNERHKLASFCSSIVNVYGDGSSVTAPIGSYGMLLFEDDLEYYVSQFHILQGKVISIDVKVSDYVQPTLSVKGDTKLRGEVMVADPTGTQYTCVDPNVSFVGVNTDERTIRYTNRYSTTRNVSASTARHHLYVTMDAYPNAVFERTAPATMAVASSLTVKRKTDSALASVLPFGASVSFEMEDGTDKTTEIGNVFMEAEAVDQGVTKAGFGVTVNDGAEGEPVQFRTILRVDNAGSLSVNQLDLGGVVLNASDLSKLLQLIE